MTPDELLAIMNYLRERISLESNVAEKPIMITFATPTEEEMLAAGLNAEGVKRILRVHWWQEMVADIEETPDMCDPDEPPKQVLAYARDVVSEYIRKRFPLNPK
jgi:hypothetical protein